MNTLEQHPALWVPVFGTAWSIIQMWWWAGKGKIHYSPGESLLSLGLICAYIWAFIALEITGWQAWFIGIYLILAVGVNVRIIARGHKWDDWSGTEAFIATFLSLGVLWIWVSGIS